jgi:hypothetical protein
VHKFSQVLGTDHATATFFLGASNWHVETALNSFLSSVGSQQNMYVPIIQPEAALVSGLEITQQGIFSPQQSISVAWIFQNTGSSAWPDEACLVFTEGTQLNGPSMIPLGPVAAGELIQLPIQLIMPTEPGSYAGTWRLTHNGGYFGDPVWVIVNVGAEVQPFSPFEQLSPSIMQHPSGDTAFGQFGAPPNDDDMDL